MRLDFNKLFCRLSLSAAALLGASILHVSVFAQLMVITQSAFAEDGATPPIEFVHAGLTPETLPTAGSTVTLKIALANSQDLGSDLQTLVTLDGRLMELPLQQAVLNERDQPAFTVSFVSPVAEVAYQFFVRTKDGKSLASKRYVARRACLPDISLSDKALAQIQKDDPSLRDDKNLSAGDLVKYSRTLKAENENLDQVLTLISSIKGALPPESSK